MENLNAERIKKALECCHSHDYKNCPECPYNKDTEKACFMLLMENALALIKELSNDVEDWKILAKDYRDRFAECNKEKAKLTEERDGLKNHNAYLKVLIDNAFIKEIKGFDEHSAAKAVAEAEMWQRIALREKELIEENDTMYRLVGETLWQKVSIKADTVQKMQERLIAEIEQTPNANEHFIKAWRTKIDQIAKEMLEGL